MHVEPPRQFHSPHPCVFFSGRSFVLFFFFASTMEKEKKKEVISVACKNSKRRIIRWRKPTLAYRILLLSWGPPLRVDDERPFVYRFVSSNDETARRHTFMYALLLSNLEGTLLFRILAVKKSQEGRLTRRISLRPRTKQKGSPVFRFFVGPITRTSSQNRRSYMDTNTRSPYKNACFKFCPRPPWSSRIHTHTAAD